MKKLMVIVALLILLFPNLAAADQDSIVMVGKEANVQEGDVLFGSVVVFGSDAVIKGHVRDSVVAIFGNIYLEPTAIVDGSVVSVGGTLTRKPGAQVGGEQVSLGLGDLNIGNIPLNIRPFRWASPLSTLWKVLSVVFLGWILFWLFPGPVLTISTAVQAEPVKAVLYGLLAYLAIIPLSLVLLITLLGIPLIPLVWLALFVGRFMGQVVLGLLAGRYLSKQLNREMGDALSVVLGLLSLGVLTMIPVVGGLASMFYGLLGLGAVVWTRFGRKSIA